MKKENISKRKLKAAETKKKIYESARQLALNHGIENVSVDSIVKAAGVSKGSFYVHFQSKDALTANFVNEYTANADLNYKSFLESLPENESVLDILILLAGKISDFIETNIGLENMRVLYKAHLTKTINTTPAMSYNRDLYKLFTEVLEKGLRQGELREDMPIDSLAKHLIMAIRGITFEWCIRYPDYDLKHQIKEHFKILLYGLKK
ncbi:MAG: TetR/AcrR family transcriptional regulator [Anaerovoracaceae bacterium]